MLTFEDMIRVETLKLVCRIWRKPDYSLPYSFIVRSVIDQATGILEDDTDMRTMATKIVELECVSAVEIVYRDGDGHKGNGVCVYKDWP